MWTTFFGCYFSREFGFYSGARLRLLQYLHGSIIVCKVLVCAFWFCFLLIWRLPIALSVESVVNTQRAVLSGYLSWKRIVYLLTKLLIHIWHCLLFLPLSPITHQKHEHNTNYSSNFCVPTFTQQLFTILCTWLISSSNYFRLSPSRCQSRGLLLVHTESAVCWGIVSRLLQFLQLLKNCTFQRQNLWFAQYFSKSTST